MFSHPGDGDHYHGDHDSGDYDHGNHELSDHNHPVGLCWESDRNLSYLWAVFEEPESLICFLSEQAVVPPGAPDQGRNEYTDVTHVNHEKRSPQNITQIFHPIMT